MKKASHPRFVHEADELLTRLGGPDTQSNCQKILDYWHGCEDPAESMAFFKKVLDRSKQDSLPKDHRIAVTWLLSEMLHDQVDEGKL